MSDSAQESQKRHFSKIRPHVLVQKIAEELGTIEGGRGRRLVEKIVPQTADTAYPGSLSSKYGLGPLPLHTETAHWPIPCRYVVIGCADAGPTPTPTVLLNVSQIRLSEPEASACESAVCRFPLRFDPGFPLRTDPA